MRPALVQALLFSLSLLVGGCALRSPSIADVHGHPGRYADRTIEVEGTVTTSWGVPLMPFTVYKIDDGTGELTIVGRGSRVPARGTRVRVKGRLNDFATVGGRSIGLHIEERHVSINRRRS